MSLLLLLKTAPASAIPHVNSKSYKLLALLAKGDLVPEIHILDALGGNYRSQIQALKGKRYEFWRIQPVYDDEGIIVGRILDKQHLSGDARQDAKARALRRLELAQESLEQSNQGQARAEKAHAELVEAGTHFLELERENALAEAKAL